MDESTAAASALSSNRTSPSNEAAAMPGGGPFPSNFPPPPQLPPVHAFHTQPPPFFPSAAPNPEQAVESMMCDVPPPPPPGPPPLHMYQESTGDPTLQPVPAVQEFLQPPSAAPHAMSGHMVGCLDISQHPQCYLVYTVDAPAAAARANPNIDKAYVYVPYEQHEAIPMIHRNLLAALDVPPDMCEWPHNPKFVLRVDSKHSVTVHLLAPNNFFSHIALPGAAAAAADLLPAAAGSPDDRDAHSKPHQYMRRTPRGKMKGTNVRPFDIYLFVVGNWDMLNKVNEAKLKINAAKSSLWYEIITEVVQFPIEQEVQKTMVGIEIPFSSLHSITVLDKWQVAIRLRAPPLLYQAQTRYKPKNVTRKIPVPSFVRQDRDPLAEGQLLSCLTHRVILSKCGTNRLVDYLLDLEDANLTYVQFLEQPQVYFDENARGRSAEMIRSALTDVMHTTAAAASAGGVGSASSASRRVSGETAQAGSQPFGEYSTMTASLKRGVLNSSEAAAAAQEQQSGTGARYGKRYTGGGACCSCASGKCMTKRCGCLRSATTCTFDCSCVRCENPLNVIKVVHKVPLERLKHDHCLIANIIKSPVEHLARINDDPTLFTSCCRGEVSLQQLLPLGTLPCPSCKKLSYQYSWCLNALLVCGAKIHCDPCGSCKDPSFVHCINCEKCYDAGPNGDQHCSKCFALPAPRQLPPSSFLLPSTVSTAADLVAEELSIGDAASGSSGSSSIQTLMEGAFEQARLEPSSADQSNDFSLHPKSDSLHIPDF